MNLLTFLSMVTDDTRIVLWDAYIQEEIGSYSDCNEISISEASKYEVVFFKADAENIITIFLK